MIISNRYIRLNKRESKLKHLVMFIPKFTDEITIGLTRTPINKGQTRYSIPSKIRHADIKWVKAL